MLYMEVLKEFLRKYKIVPFFQYKYAKYKIKMILPEQEIKPATLNK